MALILETTNVDAISLQEYVDWMNAKVQFDDIDSVLASAPMLRALANNRSFFSEYLARSLQDFATFQLGNAYTAPIFLLACEPRFIIRANVWDPPTEGQQQDEVFSYHVLHDHNFSFMTAGYRGTGYETSLYEYDCRKIRGEIGETVDLVSKGKAQLSEGKVMFLSGVARRPPARVSSRDIYLD